MREKQQYSFVVLRYVHDVLTAEFVNVGVVMYVHQTGEVLAGARQTMGRLRGVFPDLDRTAFLSAMRNVRNGFRKIAKRKSNDGLFTGTGSILAIAKEAVPSDDSSLQWSSAGGGFTSNPAETFARLYAQFVTRYDSQSKHRRTDDEVWRPVMEKLIERNLAAQLQEKTIVSTVDDVTFKHAWKNGRWHVYEPVSFDLAEADSIKTKAREWLGHLAAVASGEDAEPFKAHFLLGAPSDPRLHDAYEAAKKILQRAPNEPEIFEEGQVDDLVNQIEDEVRAHSQGASH